MSTRTTPLTLRRGIVTALRAMCSAAAQVAAHAADLTVSAAARLTNAF
jgi:hypothetical protein